VQCKTFHETIKEEKERRGKGRREMERRDANGSRKRQWGERCLKKEGGG